MSFELQNTLSTVIQQLASFFGMTTDTIMQNAPEWLAKYGWYSFYQNVPLNIFLSLLLAGGLAACLYFFIYIICEAESQWWGVGIVIMSIALIVVFHIVCYLQCAVSPELYGLNALIALIKSK